MGPGPDPCPPPVCSRGADDAVGPYEAPKIKHRGSQLGSSGAWEEVNVSGISFQLSSHYSPPHHKPFKRSSSYAPHCYGPTSRPRHVHASLMSHPRHVHASLMSHPRHVHVSFMSHPGLRPEIRGKKFISLIHPCVLISSQLVSAG